MRRKLDTPIAVLALCAGALLPAAVAVAATGGASAPTPAPSANTTAGAARKVRPSGIATWFGPGFYGNRTACGQRLTPRTVGVANRRLPCGTLVKVGYKGRTMIVPVLDRGPYSHHASWDLTAGAAQALGITETVRISTSVVGATPNVPTLGSPPAPPTTPAASAAGGTSAG